MLVMEMYSLGWSTKLYNVYQDSQIENDIEIPNYEIGIGNQHAQIYYDSSIYIIKAKKNM